MFRLRPCPDRCARRRQECRSGVPGRPWLLARYDRDPANGSVLGDSARRSRKPPSSRARPALPGERVLRGSRRSGLKRSGRLSQVRLARRTRQRRPPRPATTSRDRLAAAAAARGKLPRASGQLGREQHQAEPVGAYRAEPGDHRRRGSTARPGGQPAGEPASGRDTDHRPPGRDRDRDGDEEGTEVKAGFLGTWKVLGAVTLLVPGRALLKEWACAGPSSPTRGPSPLT